jgi:hypothetical protein
MKDCEDTLRDVCVQREPRRDEPAPIFSAFGIADVSQEVRGGVQVVLPTTNTSLYSKQNQRLIGGNECQ